MKKLLTFFLITLISLTLFTPVFAQSETGESGFIWEGTNCNVEGACTLCDALIVGSNIMNFLIQVSFSLGALMIVAGGIMMMIAGSSEKRYTQGKQSVTWAVTGLFVALSSWVIINTIIHIISGDPSLPWATVSC
ncbi:MAG: hypothetical protein WDZ80_04675 [Candidatus Paceibacterota bacterium]